MYIQVLSRAILGTQYMAIDEPTIIISITEREGRDLYLKGNDNIKDILYLHFDDEVEGNNVITKEQANQIKDFIEKNINVPNLIVQCFAGVSRSAGVAAAISLAINGYDSQIFNNGKFVPNMFVYRKVLEAFGFKISYEEEQEKELTNLDAWKKNQDL